MSQAGVLLKLLDRSSDEMLVWLSVWSKVQIVCMWSSWCRCSSKPRHLLPHLNPGWFYLSGTAYSSCPGKEAIERCRSSSSSSRSSVISMCSKMHAKQHVVRVHLECWHLLHYPVADHTDLICRVVVLFQIRMCKRLFHGDSFVWVERQHLVQ